MEIHGNWNDLGFTANFQPTVSWNRIWTKWAVTVSGGIVRKMPLSIDGLALVICHELGHGLGGFPKITLQEYPYESLRPSSQGQADYFSTSKCLRRYFSSMDNVQAISKMQIPFELTEKCQHNFTDREEAALCQRSIMAGYSVTLSLRKNKEYRYWGLTEKIDLDKPAASVLMIKSQEEKMSFQCRLETFIQGSLCQKSVDEGFSNTDFRQGACTRIEGYSENEGVRPLCWFRSKYF